MKLHALSALYPKAKNDRKHLIKDTYGLIKETPEIGHMQCNDHLVKGTRAERDPR
jgi:hypothetical protein